MRAILSAWLLVLGFGTVGLGGALDCREIAADAKWLAHLDFDAVRAAKLAQAAHEEFLTRPQARQKLDEVRRVLGIDLIEDLRSLTFYGKRLIPDRGVVILRAKMDQPRLLALVELAPNHRTGAYGGYTLHTWINAKGAPQEHTITGCFRGETMAVLGRDVEEVKAALDVLDGKAVALAGSGSPLDADLPAGTIFQAAVLDLASADLPFKSPIVRQTELLVFLIGEHQGEVFCQAKLVAKVPGVAEQVRSVVEGFRALIELQDENPNAKRIARTLKVATDKNTVTADWRMSVDDLLKLIAEEISKREPPKPTN